MLSCLPKIVLTTLFVRKKEAAVLPVFKFPKRHVRCLILN